MHTIYSATLKTDGSLASFILGETTLEGILRVLEIPGELLGF